MEYSTCVLFCLTRIPLPQFKILRIFRIIRVYRLGQVYGGSRMVKEFFANRGGSALLSLIFIMLLILEFGGLAMLSVESQSPDANITDASDAVWYVYVTITTVGYGDQYPVTNIGRILGVLIMTVGVGLFGTITAFLANAFVGSEGEESSETANPAVDPAEMMAQMEEIKNMLLAYERTNTDLKDKIESLETTLKTGNG
ncbi:MAG: potassium channel family protein [Chloroflexota bacterium]